MEISLPLNTYHLHKTTILLNRSYMVMQLAAISYLARYRISSFLDQENKITITSLLVFASELLLTFNWLLDQSTRWNPLSRTTFPERLKAEYELPSVDVFVFTVDPDKEPTFEVMNTVVSAMALDYPAEKLNVYLSDDGGSALTLQCLRVAYEFAKWWVPFRRRYGIKIGSPQAYFSTPDHIDDLSDTLEFLRDREIIKQNYETFEREIRREREEWRFKSRSGWSSVDHPAVVEILQHDDNNNKEIPLLVYVSRQKKPSHPHNFKGGALNVLLRISGVISNSPYILVLDCDMYCNDPSSAKHAMCFHLDPKMSPELAFVQFPQAFNNISKNDIYDSQLRNVFKTVWLGFDGLRGPTVSGTNFYMKKEALFRASVHNGIELLNTRSYFGSSEKFIESLCGEYKPNFTDTNSLKEEAKVLASSNYEDQTKWGEKVGFRYGSVLEDYFTSFHLHCQGWKSVYVDPPKAQFLGTPTTSLNDLLIQATRWSTGLFEVGLSKYCPLVYGPLRMSFLYCMTYGGLAFSPLYCFPLWCLATIPQLCLLNGIALYPEVSSPAFKVICFIFISSLSKHLHEVLISGHSIQTWKNENRLWMIKAVTSQLYGTLDAVMKKLKLRQASFVATNKILDGEQMKRYELGIFDFQTTGMFLVPLVTLILINLSCLVVGVTRVVHGGSMDKMFTQLFLSIYILVVNYAVIDGMLLRKDKGRITLSVSLCSVAFAFVFLLVGSILLI